MVTQAARIERCVRERPVVVFGYPNAAGRRFERSRAAELRIDPAENAFRRPMLAQRPNARAIELFEFVVNAALGELRPAGVDEQVLQAFAQSGLAMRARGAR
jgi:hypothetical protein